MTKRIFVLFLSIPMILMIGFRGYSDQDNRRKAEYNLSNCDEHIDLGMRKGSVFSSEGQPTEAGYSFDFEFSLNCIRIPETLFQANASFHIGYLVFLDKSSHPRSAYLLTFDKGIANLTKGVLDSEEVISCIKKWKFAGLNPDSTYTILLRWEHMKGWVTMMIYSDKMNLYINLLPEKN
jgi:hypothetical protein